MIKTTDLPSPSVIEDLDYFAILKELIKDLKSKPGFENWREDLESDPARKILEVCAYRELMLRQRINSAARAVLVLYATGADLDHLAAWFGISRLPAARASFKGKILFSSAITADIPAGFRVRTKDGEISAVFRENLHVNDRDWGSGVFDLETPGARWNGDFQPLEWICETALPYVTGVEQMSPISGGGDLESDSAFRLRLMESLDRFTTAGPVAAYDFWVRTADERVKDVSVFSPSPGLVKVCVLANQGDGTPEDSLLDLVSAQLNDEKIRPLTDRVVVSPVEVVPYSVSCRIWVYPYGNPERAVRAAREALENMSADLHRLGADITLTRLHRAASVSSDVQRAEFDEPLFDITVSSEQAAFCQSVSVIFAGLAE